MIEKINLFSNISFNSNKIEKKKNVETQNAAELPKSFSVPSGKLLHSYMHHPHFLSYISNPVAERSL